MGFDEQDFNDFYQHWGPSVFSFCHMFLGDEQQAELATQNAFVEYVRGRYPFELESLPRNLVRFALREALKLAPPSPRFPDTEELEGVLSMLEPADRAVFILRTVLDLPLHEVANITQLTNEQVNESWMKASLYLRDIWLK